MKSGSGLWALLAAAVVLTVAPLGAGPDVVAAEYTWNGVEWVWNDEVTSFFFYANFSSFVSFTIKYISFQD